MVINKIVPLKEKELIQKIHQKLIDSRKVGVSLTGKDIVAFTVKETEVYKELAVAELKKKIQARILLLASHVCDNTDAERYGLRECLRMINEVF